MTKPTKHIAFIVKYFPTVSETFIVNQINGLIEAGYQVNLYAYQQVSASIVHKSLNTHNLLQKVQYFVKPPEQKFLRLWFFLKWTVQHFTKIKWELFFKTLNILKYGKEAYTLKLFFEAQWFLVPYDFELIHAHFGMNGNRIAYLKSRGIIPQEIPLITTFHGYDIEPNKLQSYTKDYADLLKQATAFTVNTPYLEGILQQINTLNIPCHILPVGLDTNYFTRQAKKTKTPYFDIVFCGKLIPLKGPDTAIVILKNLHNKGYTQVRLHLIGDGEMRDDLKALVAHNNLQNVVKFYGKLSQEDIKQRFEQADVFVMPGRYDIITGRAETQGLVIQEAQAMELPVVVSDVGGMKYGVLPNESGLVLKEDDEDGFVTTIETLIKNPMLKYDMGFKGSNFVKAHYDNVFLTKNLIKIYESVVRKQQKNLT